MLLFSEVKRLSCFKRWTLHFTSLTVSEYFFTLLSAQSWQYPDRSPKSYSFRMISRVLYSAHTIDSIPMVDPSIPFYRAKTNSSNCLLLNCAPSKQETLNQCMFDAGPSSTTSTQHWFNISCLLGNYCCLSWHGSLLGGVRSWGPLQRR